MINNAENNLATEESRNLSAILSSMGEGLIIVDKQLKITLMNQVAGVLLRVAPADGMSKDVHELFTFFQKGQQIPPEDSPISRAIRDMSTVKVKLEYDFFCKNKAGQLFPIEITVTSPPQYGNVGGVIIFSDVTREKEVDRMKTEFVSIASHQLRTPLTAIRLFVEMLMNQEAGKLNAKQKLYIDNVYESTERMIHLVNDLLNVSRLEAGRLKIEPMPTQLEDFIQRIINEAAPLGESKKCKIILEKPKTKLEKISIDPALLRQVIDNLVMNAIRYSPLNQCDIVVKVEKRSRDYLISVQDAGIGVPKVDHPRVFERFYRADNARKAAAEGSGLGLYVVKMIIEASGGKIWFESPPSGKKKGTIFYVSIPSKGMEERKGERSLAT